MSLKPATAILVSLFAIGALAQTPAPSNAQNLLDQIAGCIDSGNLNVDVHLQPGRIPASPQWTIEVLGTPTATLVADAAGGRVRNLDLTIKDGSLVIIGKGLRPTVLIDDLHFKDGEGITAAHFRGRGIWRPIVAIFRPLARSALRSIDLRTDIPAVMRGNIIGPVTTTQTASTSGASFLDLVKDVDIHDSNFVASGGRPLSFGNAIELKTASTPTDGQPLHASIDRGEFQPGGPGGTARFDIAGKLDGQIEDGAIAFVGDRCTFSHGDLRQGTFRVTSSADAQMNASLSAGALDLELTSGQFRWPGGPRIGVEAPSHLTIRNLDVQPDGGYSGLVDAALSGKVGALERDASVVSASDVKLRTHGAKIVNGKATGDVQLEFNYRLDYTLVVRYPVKEIGDRHVQLLFEGLFVTDLHFENAGAGGEGNVAGTYHFTVPWEPIQQAAFEVLRTKWSQDVTPAVRDVVFTVEPRHFGPCGGSCFLVNLNVSARKRAGGYRFRQMCHTEGQADLVVDAASRSLVLRNVRIDPRCKGLLGSVVNLLGPFFTKSYTDITLFQMPAGLPFTVESVGGAADFVSIAGKVEWSSASTPTVSAKEARP